MKQIMVLGCVVLVSIVLADGLRKRDVPAAVREVVSTKYPKARDIDWQKKGPNYEVEFEVGDVETVLLIDPSGTIINTEEGTDDDEKKGNGDEAGTRPVAGPSLAPLADKVTFSSEVTHPYLPLSSVRHAELVEDDERILRKVIDTTRTVGGVECLVLEEHEYKGGKLKEISYNFFAQDPQGNVYYFGEDVDMYQDDKVTGHSGAWIVGPDTKEPCLFMPADLRVGFSFKRENSPPAAEEFDQIEKTDASLKVPAGEYNEVLVVCENDRKPGPPWKERKYYARGVGLISEDKTLNLTEYRGGQDKSLE